MGDWKITVSNMTGSGGLKPVTMDFMLFQTVPDPLSVDSWSSAWKVAEVGYPASVGPIELPTRVEFNILDESHDNPRKTGPFDVKFGEHVEVTQDTSDATPTIKTTGGKAKEGEILVTNKSGNPKPLEFALYKDGKKILSFKEVKPGESAHLAIEPTIYIAEVHSQKEGDDFKADVESAKATQFKLSADKPKVNIGIYQEKNEEIKFKPVD